ncbi:hypothetical protein BKA69DRAFT_1037393 [Paraphysoderma sedebokerense]|nr:hypothetical protein BKA69DRAFT_1037393 [Paraphysoderma sedebokerense]
MSTRETFFGIVRNIEDAIQLIEAANIGIIPILKKSPTIQYGKERIFPRPGSVYVWREKDFGYCDISDGIEWSYLRHHGGMVEYIQTPNCNAIPTTGFRINQSRIHKKKLVVKDTTDSTLYHLTAYFTVPEVSLKCHGRLPVLSRRTCAYLRRKYLSVDYEQDSVAVGSTTTGTY